LHYYIYIYDVYCKTLLYTFSLHDALPIYYQQPVDFLGGRPVDLAVDAGFGHRRRDRRGRRPGAAALRHVAVDEVGNVGKPQHQRSEEHTSELQSRENAACPLLLEKKHPRV